MSKNPFLTDPYTAAGLGRHVGGRRAARRRRQRFRWEFYGAPTRYGLTTATAWDGLCPRLGHRGAWATHPGELPIVAGTLSRLQVERLPATTPRPRFWLWSSATSATDADVDRWWQSFLRRFDLEHTFRLFKQTLGWTTRKIRTPHAADRWTWIAAYTQLRLARTLAVDLRRPWEQPVEPDRLTPPGPGAGFAISARTCPIRPEHSKYSRPGPGRPRSSPNRNRATRHDVGKRITSTITDRTRPG